MASKMPSICNLLLLLTALAPVEALQLNVGRQVGASATRPIAKPWPINMKSNEDKEFEEWGET